jgi:hypothetical protein
MQQKPIVRMDMSTVGAVKDDIAKLAIVFLRDGSGPNFGGPNGTRREIRPPIES